jgi:hypothetical protein
MRSHDKGLAYLSKNSCFCSQNACYKNNRQFERAQQIAAGFNR